MSRMLWVVMVVLSCREPRYAKIDEHPGDESDPSTDLADSQDSAADAMDDDTGGFSALSCPQLVLRDGGRFSMDALYASSLPSSPGVLGSCGWGLAVIDLNEDDWPDLLLAGAYDYTTPLINASGALQSDVSIRFDDKYGMLPQGNGFAVGDLNGDGRPDFVLTRSSGAADRVYFNQGGGEFESVELPESLGESQTPTVFDADGDGDLDVFVGRHIDVMQTSPVALEAGTLRGDDNRLYINDGGSFTAGGTLGPADAATFQGAPLDVDNDGDLDVYMVNDFGMFVEPTALMLNQGGGVFVEADECRCDFAMFGMGAAVSDANNDHIPDLHLTDFGSPKLMYGMGDASFYDGAAATGALISPSADRVTSWGTTFVDLNQDGWDELATVFGPVLVGIPGDWSDEVSNPDVAALEDSPVQKDALHLNQEGHFAEASDALGFGQTDVGRSVVVADFNRDGVPDLATSGMTSTLEPYVQLWFSEGGCGAGVVVDFAEMGPKDIGAKVEWKVGDRAYTRWFLPSTTFSSSGSTLHLGLGGMSEAEWVRITPVGGEAREYTNVGAGQWLDQRSYQ